MNNLHDKMWSNRERTYSKSTQNSNADKLEIRPPSTEAEKQYVYISPAKEENLQGNFRRSTQFRKTKLNARRHTQHCRLTRVTSLRRALCMLRERLSIFGTFIVKQTKMNTQPNKVFFTRKYLNTMIAIMLLLIANTIFLNRTEQSCMGY